MLALPNHIKRDAVFDPTQDYRYQLWRQWDEKAPSVGFVMLNPSQADAIADDPTIRRCLNFAQLWGYGSLSVVNLFAYRTSKPEFLRQVSDPIGLENDRYLLNITQEVDAIVLAWGNQGIFLNRSQAVVHLLSGRSNLYCFGINKTGQPRHPLYLKKGNPLVSYLECRG